MLREISPYVFIYLKSFFLGVIQGFTEFLPISSTAHLKVLPYFLGWKDPGASFSASIQLGSAVAIIYYFRNQIGLIIDSFFSIFVHPCALLFCIAFSMPCWIDFLSILPPNLAPKSVQIGGKTQAKPTPIWDAIFDRLLIIFLMISNTPKTSKMMIFHSFL